MPGVLALPDSGWRQPGPGRAADVRLSPDRLSRVAAHAGEQRRARVRIESSVTSISWIPSEAIIGMTKLPFAFGVAHYDDPPPDRDRGPGRPAGRRQVPLRQRAAGLDRRRRRRDRGLRLLRRRPHRLHHPEARLARHDARGHRVRGPAPGARAERRARSRFSQTAGGQTGAPAPRRVSHPPFVKIQAPTAWTTLELTINADGTSNGKLIGCSPFPRHWIYDHQGTLIEKSGLIEFKSWYRHAFGKHSPWGDEESPAFATAVETALERQLSMQIMRGGVEPKIKKVGQGQDAREAGRRGQRALPRPRRRPRSRGRRRGRGRVRPGRRARRARADRGPRQAHRDAACGHQVQGRGAPGRADIAPESLAELSETHHQEDGQA